MSTSSTAFDPDNVDSVKHTKVGVWDLYEDVTPELAKLPGGSRLEGLLEGLEGLPYVFRMFKDIASIRQCVFYLALYVSASFLASLLPAVSVWYSGQLLKVQTAVEERTIDTELLLHVAVGRFSSSVAKRVLGHVTTLLAVPLNARIKQYYSVHTFHAMARLDVPTFDEDSVQRQLQQSVSHNSRSSIAWETVTSFLHICTTVVQLVSQVTVLLTVLHGQRDGRLFAMICFAQSVVEWGSIRRPLVAAGVWAATTKDADYIRNEGLKRVVSSSLHRKEIVAGGMWEYLHLQFQQGVDHVGDKATDFWDSMSRDRKKDRLTFYQLIRDPLQELPQIIFSLRAVQYPASVPVSLASLHLITSTTSSFSYTLFRLFDDGGSIADKLGSIRKLYEVDNIPNRITDGHIPFPEDQQSLLQGVSIEFKEVSFKYPGSDSFTLDKVSFKIEQGQLCVIVGENGSGKSTVLKLIARLYDATEGQILVNDLDIRTIKLADLRRATSVLFQDYSLFPLTIAENIGLGDPSQAKDITKIREAARLGGADVFVDNLPDGFDSYIERPVSDYYGGLPEGTSRIFGRPVDHTRLRRAARGGGGLADAKNGLSGGQMQRVALSRTFMRSLVSSESKIGLLLFDEPSASLDPTAEHDLFQRLRELRGNKTMMFSSHRFGNLTRHADLILYMHKSAVEEEGTHEELLKRGGEYARIWNLQAQAFL